MKSFSDQELLREYLEHQSEAAFAEFLSRHVDLVYSSALRIVRDSHLAEDVTQSVFLAVARNASALALHPLIVGWLHRTTQNLAANAVRQEVRRRVREKKATEVNDIGDVSGVWERVEPHIEDALSALRDEERHLVLLRYFQGKSAREIGSLTGTTEGTVQKRLNRAIEKLGLILRTRGVSVGAPSLGTSLLNDAVIAAPKELADTVVNAVAKTILNHFVAFPIAKGVFMSTMQKGIVGLSLAIAVGTGIYEVRKSDERDWEAKQSVQALDDLNSRYKALRNKHDEALSEIKNLRQSAERLTDEAAEVHRLRGLVGELRREAETREVLPEVDRSGQFSDYLARIEHLRTIFEMSPHEAIPEMQLISDKEWLESSMLLLDESPESVEKAKAHLRTLAKGKFALHLNRALQKYIQESGGFLPATADELHDFLSPAIGREVFERYEVVRTGSTNSLNGTDTVLREKQKIKSPFETQFSISLIGAGYATKSGSSDRTYGFSYSFDDMPQD